MLHQFPLNIMCTFEKTQIVEASDHVDPEVDYIVMRLLELADEAVGL